MKRFALVALLLLPGCKQPPPVEHAASRDVAIVEQQLRNINFERGLLEENAHLKTQLDDEIAGFTILAVENQKLKAQLQRKADCRAVEIKEPGDIK